MSHIEDERADRWARRAAVAVGAIALALVVIPGVDDLVTEANAPADQVTTKVIDADGTKTVETTTASPAPPGLIDKTIAEPGILLLLKLGIGAMAAFVSAAVVQRVLVGDFAFRAGALELPARQLREVAATTGTAVEELSRRIDDSDAVEDKTLDEVLSLLEVLIERLDDGHEAASGAP